MVILFLLLVILGGLMATPQQHEEARQRWDRIGRSVFPFTVALVVIWYIRG